MRAVTCSFLSLMVSLLLQESVLAQSMLQVQLLRYENPRNLEFRPNVPDGPFCCCNMATPCSSVATNLTSAICNLQCELRISVCVQTPADPEGQCTLSSIQTSPPLVDFTGDPPLFSEGASRLILPFTLDDSSSSGFNLTVTMEERSGSEFDLIDIITINVDECSLSSPTMDYVGIHGIASVTLGYVIATTSELYRNCVDPDVSTMINVSMSTETETITQTERITEIERVTETEMVILRTTVTRETLATVDPLAVETTEDSTSPWKPVAIVLIVILGLGLLAAIVITVASCYVWRRQSRESKDVTSYNPVSEEVGVSASPKQDIVGDEVVPGIFTNLSEEILAAVPSLDEIDVGNVDVDSFTSEPDQTAEQVSIHAEDSQQPPAEVHDKANSLSEDQDPSEDLYAFERL